MTSLSLLVLLPGCSTLADRPRLVPPTVTEDPTLPAIEVAVLERVVRLHVKTFGGMGRNTQSRPLRPRTVFPCRESDEAELLGLMIGGSTRLEAHPL